jgi:TRAP-type C4-dicarboxylate transport system permease small subunit
MQNNIKKAGSTLLDIIEIYLPAVAFMVMFLAFNLQIFYRYVLNNPLQWTWEGTIIAYIWTILFATGLATRNHAHVKFTLIYDRVSDRARAWFRITGDLIIVSAFILIAYPSYDFIAFMRIKKSAVFGIPFSIIYFPFMVFLATTIGHKVYDIVTDARQLAQPKRSEPMR